MPMVFTHSYCVFFFPYVNLWHFCIAVIKKKKKKAMGRSCTAFLYIEHVTFADCQMSWLIAVCVV